MLYNKYDDEYMDDDFTGNQDSDDDNWDIYADDDIPEKIEWLEEIDNDDLENYSFEDDFDDMEFDDD
jgi:hypothetical protein